MRTIRALLSRLRALPGRDQADRALTEELESHLQMHVEDNIRAGMTPAEARRDALIKSGGLEPAKEAYRDRRRLPLLETIVQDLRYGLRTMRKSPGFTAVVALTLALGIGANTAIFSVIHAALSPIAVRDADRVVIIWTESPARNWRQLPASVPDYLDWKTSGVFSSLGALHDAGFNLRIGDRTERILGIRVTSELLEVLCPRPQLGRIFRADDSEAGHDQVVVLSDALWRSRFATDPAIIGRTVTLDGTPHTIIGVLPKRVPKLSNEEIYAPLVFAPPADTSRKSHSFTVVGRLQPGISLAAAQKRMTDLGTRLGRQYPDNAGTTFRLQPIDEAMVEDARALLIVLFGAVGFVLLIACANIANLLLARGAGRGKEMAIRTALGAGRGRLCRQLLVENMLLAVLGGLLAIVPGVWAIHFIASFHLDELPNADLVTPNASVLAFNFVLSLATGLVFGLVPAWQVWKADVNSTLKAASRSQTGGVHQRMRGLLVVGEVALTMVLLAGSGLMLRSFLRLRSANPGYNSQGVLTMRLALSEQQYATPQAQTAFFEQVVERARALPGIESVSATEELPASDEIHGSGLLYPDRPEPRPEDVPIVLRDSAMPDYFRAMRIPLLRGRYFNETDRPDSRPVAVVDEWTAKRYWPNQDPVGQSLKLGSTQPVREIVGVVGAVDQGVVVRILKGRLGQVYVPFAQEAKPAVSLVVRTHGDPATQATPMRDVVRGIDIDQPVFRVQTLDAVRASARASQQLATWLLGGFAAVALLLASIGLYGLMAYNVGQRTREFGIRMSLGARQQDVLRLVARQGILLTLAGMLLGLAGALALTRLMGSLLYGVTATDPLTYAGVTGLLALVAALASYIPARRATLVDPVTALRCE